MLKHFDTEASASLLGVSPRTLERWRISGQGPAYRKIGGRVVYAETDLIGFSEKCRRISTSETRA